MEDQKENPLGVLFNVLAYNNISEYEEYISRLNKGLKSDILLTIHSALRYAQANGIYSIEESETIAICLRKLKDSIDN